MNSKGKIVTLQIGWKRGIPKTIVSAVRIETDWGIMGDAHAGKWARQISLFALESLKKVPPSRWEQCQENHLTENITMIGLPLDYLQPGALLKLGTEVILRIESIGKEHYVEEGRSYIISREGRFCTVLRGGIVTQGDSIQIMTTSKYEESLRH